MGRLRFYSFLTAVVLLLPLSTVVYSDTFTDTFDDPVFSNSNWVTFEEEIQQVWTFPSINGTNLGYHASTTSISPPAVKIAQYGVQYYNSGLSIETLMRINFTSNAYSSESYAGVAFALSQENRCIVSLQLDFDGPTEIKLQINFNGDDIDEIPVSINFDTFYKLVVQVDSNKDISAHLYELDGTLLGSVFANNILSIDSGAVGIFGTPEVTFDDFKLVGNPVGQTGTLSQTQISQLYVSIFGRASEGEGNSYWQVHSDMANAADAMLDTQAAKDYFGANLNTNQAFIEHIYLNTLNKTIADDSDGITYWVGMLNAGTSRGEAVATLVGAIKNYAPDGPYYNPDDAATIAAYNQFMNRVAVSDYMADNVYDPPDDWETLTSFNHGMVVNHDPATVYAAMVMLNGFIEVNQDDQGIPTEPVKTENYDHCSHEPFFSSYVPENHFVYQEMRHNRTITTVFEKSFPLTEAERVYLKNFVFETWDLYWNEFGGFPFDSYTVAFGEGYETCSGFGDGFDASFTKTNWISHKIFHAWNGNAFRQENERMWFMEGVTTYYGDIRHQDEIEYQSILGSFVEYYFTYVAQGRDRAIGDMSLFDADYDHSFVAQKGAVLAYLLDKKLSETGHHLGEVVRLIYQRYGIDEKTGHPTNQEILSIFNEVSGEQFDSFFQQYIYGTELLPVERSNFVWIDH